MKGKKMGDGSGFASADASRPRKLVPGLGYQFRLNSDGWLKLSDGRAWVAFPPEAAVALRDFLAEGAGTMIRLLILSLLLTGCSGEPYGGAASAYWALSLLTLVAIFVCYTLAIRLAQANRIIRSQESHIEKLNADQLVLLDERNRYKGALEAVLPAPGEVHVTRIVRGNQWLVRDMLRQLIRSVGVN